MENTEHCASTQSLLRAQEVTRYPSLPPAGARPRNTRPAGTRGQVQEPATLHRLTKGATVGGRRLRTLTVHAVGGVLERVHGRGGVGAGVGAHAEVGAGHGGLPGRGVAGVDHGGVVHPASVLPRQRLDLLLQVLRLQLSTKLRKHFKLPGYY